MVGRFAEDFSAVLWLAGVDDTAMVASERISLTVICPEDGPGCPSSDNGQQLCHGAENAFYEPWQMLKPPTI
eukprot:COSAG06_NODE_1932_length_8039_cov_5.660327_2_plen_72_part_00